MEKHDIFKSPIFASGNLETLPLFEIWYESSTEISIECYFFWLTFCFVFKFEAQKVEIHQLQSKREPLSFNQSDTVVQHKTFPGSIFLSHKIIFTLETS